MKGYYCSIVCILFCVLDLVLSGHIPVCRQPKVVGNCKAMNPRYYYNIKNNECELFYYGGCGGNENNFETYEECEETCVCDDIQNDFDCDKDPEVGPCKGALTRYYYDEDDGMCKKFSYGGCKGNKNNFKTKSDCYDKCGDIQNDFDCDMDPEVGPCKAAITRYYYDEDDGMCRKFIYGGCKGNKNNFETKSECYDKCGDSQNYFDCDLKYDSGPCYGYFPKYYYDKKDDKCKKFIYGGCLGNKNKFDTVSDCYRRCGDIQTNFDCDKDPVVGPCTGFVVRYYYDKYDDMCKMFLYGGCKGNKNNFMTLSDCYNKCGGSQTNFDCDKDYVVGPCEGYFPRYYYDEKDDTCKKFIYGGCLGNKNNFMTAFDCYNSCGEW